VTAEEWFGFPRGAWLVIGVEFWERFSFYGMLSILALFLTASPDQGGFGWAASTALAFVGGYSGAMYALPAFGGYLADRVLGRRRAVALGASCMLLGQVLLALPASLTAPLGSWLGAPLAFFLAILCLVTGNALMKSTLVVLCGETLGANDPRREAAYAYYYLGIAVGAMLSGVAVGWVAAHVGWHAGFGVAATGMAVALGSYLLLARRWLGSIGSAPDRPLSRKTANDGSVKVTDMGAEARRRIGLLLALAALLCAFSVGWFQLFGSWLLFIEGHVDRSIFSFVIPVPWFTSMNAAVVIGLAPLVAQLWVTLGARNRRVDILQKYAFALGMVCIGHLLMLLSAHSLGAAPIWMSMVALSLLGVGELVAWTATYGMVSRAAPAGFASVAMGAWYLLTLGLGGYLSGFTGALVDSWGFASTFGFMAGLMGAACVVALLLRTPLSRLAGRAGVSL
jgi:POT family proton-dependent oligopeptide transporter